MDIATIIGAPTRWALMKWIVKCFRGTHMKHPDLVYRKARHIKIECEQPRAFQVDGDMPRCDGPEVEDALPSAHTPLEVSIQPRALPVLVP